MPLILSKLANNNEIRIYQRKGKLLPVAKHKILINGKAGIPQRINDSMIKNDALGITEVSETQLEALQSNRIFKNWVKRGFIIISHLKKEAAKNESSKIAANMPPDKSAQLTASTIPKEIDAKPRD